MLEQMAEYDRWILELLRFCQSVAAVDVFRRNFRY
ncbi:hypothetical protein Q668_16850 [Alcanivorax sp. PN-3]|nr:hypothetical protein Q668_16850 [Alcanivorax sp. PN-3]